MRTLSIEGFLNVMQEKNYTVFQDGRLNIVGYRNRFGRPNYFDDAIVMYQKKGALWSAREYKATTLPGTPNLLKPVNTKGAAILFPGQYFDTYALGLHRRKYRALVQVKPVKVYRDNTKDSRLDFIEKTIDEGLFGINIHRASVSALIVGADSAGCQVIQDVDDYDEFIAACQASQQRRFTYTLLDL